MAESSVPLVFPSPQTEDDDCLAEMTIATASKVFIESRRLFISPRTYKDYGYVRKPLSEWFGQKKLRDFTGKDIREMQRKYSETAGPSHVNHMTSLLQQILKRAGLWEQVGRGF